MTSQLFQSGVATLSKLHFPPFLLFNISLSCKGDSYAKLHVALRSSIPYSEIIVKFFTNKPNRSNKPCLIKFSFIFFINYISFELFVQLG